MKIQTKALTVGLLVVFSTHGEVTPDKRLFITFGFGSASDARCEALVAAIDRVIGTCVYEVRCFATQFPPCFYGALADLEYVLGGIGNVWIPFIYDYAAVYGVRERDLCAFYDELCALHTVVQCHRWHGGCGGYIDDACDLLDDVAACMCAPVQCWGPGTMWYLIDTLHAVTQTLCRL